MTRSQNIALALGAASIVAMAGLAACDSTTEVEPAPPSGGGGSTATTSSSGGGGTGGGTTSSTTGGSGGAGAFANACEEACYKIEVECATGLSCDMIPGGMFDCSNPQANCPGQCVVDADCDAISETFGGNIDPDLGACIQACQGGTGGGGGGGSCITCLPGACVSELTDCYNDGSCQTFIQCAFQCPDSGCVDGCLASNPSAAADAVITCACGSCPQDCDQFCGVGS